MPELKHWTERSTDDFLYRLGAHSGTGTRYLLQGAPRGFPRPRKRGPKEERLIITGDPAEALAKLLKPKPTK